MSKRTWKIIQHFLLMELLVFSLAGAGDLRTATAQELSSDFVKKGLQQKSAARRTLESGARSEDLAQNQKITPDVLENLTFLIKSAPNDLRRVMLVINRARAVNLYVKQSLLASKRLDLNEFEKKYLNVAVTDLNQALKMPSLPKTEREKVLKALGFSYTYLGKSSNAREVLELLIRENPKSKEVGWAAVYVAEEYFASGDFNRAAYYYRNFYEAMNPSEKELAYYKLAWCFINAKEMSKAEELFRRVIRQGQETKSRQGLMKDAIRDLAFLMAHHPDVEDALKTANQLFPGVTERIEFLDFVRASLESQNNFAAHAKILETLFVIESDPEKKLQLLMAHLRINRKEFASRVHLNAFNRLAQFVRKEGFVPEDERFRKVAPLLETEVQNLLKAWIDTFGGKTKTPELIKKHEIPALLAEAFEFFDKYFVASKLRPKLLEIHLEMCTETKDWLCVDQTAEKIFAETKRDRKGALAITLELLEKAGQAQIEALEVMAQWRGADVAGLQERLFQKTRLLYSWKRRFPGWSGIAKRLFNQLMERKQPLEAAQVMEGIFEGEKTSDSFLRLQSARFEAGQFDKVIADNRMDQVIPKDQNLLGVLDLKREASLRLAMKGREKNEAEHYRSNLKQFLKMNPDPKKAAIARADFLKFLMEKGELAELLKEVKLLPPAERSRVEYQEAYERAWRELMDQGQFQEAAQMALEPVKRALAQLSGGIVSWELWRRDLKKDERDYLLGILVLSQPKKVLELLENQSLNEGALSDAERRLGHLALRMEEDTWTVKRSKRAIAILGSAHAFPPQEGLSFDFETRIEKLKFPKKGSNPKKYAKQFGELLEELSRIRQKVSAELPGRPPSDQLRALKKAQSLEQAVAQELKSSSIPEGLTETQISEYKKGLENAAKEYENQAEEYSKLMASIENLVSQRKKEEMDGVPQAPPSGTWDFSGLDLENKKRIRLKIAKQRADQGNLSAALVLLDLAKEELGLPKEEYMRARVGFVISTSPYRQTLGLRKLMVEELKRNDSLSVLKEWEK